MTSGNRRSFIATCVLLVALVASACSGSFSFSLGGESVTDAAVGLIEGDEMSRRIGVDELSDTVCDEPAAEDVGELFNCTAQSPKGPVEFEVEIEAEDRIFASPVNVVLRDFIGDYADSAVTVLNNSNGLGLPADAIDCGERAVVLNADNEMTCALTDPATGQVFDAVLTIEDVYSGDFFVEVRGEAE